MEDPYVRVCQSSHGRIKLQYQCDRSFVCCLRCLCADVVLEMQLVIGHCLDRANSHETSVESEGRGQPVRMDQVHAFPCIDAAGHPHVPVAQLVHLRVAGFPSFSNLLSPSLFPLPFPLELRDLFNLVSLWTIITYLMRIAQTESSPLFAFGKLPRLPTRSSQLWLIALPSDSRSRQSDRLVYRLLARPSSAGEVIISCQSRSIYSLRGAYFLRRMSRLDPLQL